ncbi:multidrug effflux MFS transporter [Hydrogenophilus thiooxidans]|uniref:multidrug effflux MFS transporter n=1 Tax=Hydrogenophilus thiooxidans TaxID=2820326 RepID=UPI001C223F1E|nr:multidrug effflux MFS transporter [Hydrogenophilus thiooxidans]
MAQPSPTLFALIIALVALGPLSTDLYLPALPALVADLETDVAHGQLTLTAYLIGFAVGQLVYGPLSDRFGRKPVILSGLALYAAASLACVWSENITMLLAARVVQAVGACVGPVLGRTIVRDVYGPVDAPRMLAHVGSVMAIAPMVAPLIGGVITSHFAWRGNFVALFGYAAVTLVAILWALPETNAHRGKASFGFMGAFVTLLRDPRFRWLLIANACGYAALFAFISGSSFVFIGMFGFTPVQMGLAFAVMVTGFFVGSVMSARLSRRLGAERLLRLGGSIGLVGGTAMLLWLMLAPSPLGVMLPMWLCGAAAGLLMPNATGLALAPYPTIAGAAASLLGFSQMGIAAAAGTVVGHLLTETPLPMAAVIAVVMSWAWWSTRQATRALTNASA